MKKHALVLAATAALCVTAAGQPVLAATAPPGVSVTAPSVPVLDVAARPGGFAAPSVSTSGRTSFRVNTTVTEGTGSAIGLLRPRPGVAAEALAGHLAKVFSPDKPTAMEGTRALMRDAELLGGALAQAGNPTTFTTTLRPGTYYLLEYFAFESPNPPGAEGLHRLTVTDERHSGRPPAPHTVVGMGRTPSGAPAFRVPSRVRAGAPILLTNGLDQINEAIFVPVRPGTTRADLQAFFEGVENGTPVPPPFAGRPVGSPPLTPGRTAVVQMPLTPGTYAVTTWVHDVKDGVRLAAKGMHAIVTVE
ncbi:hypothetical protein [Spirillospora sp. CA-294931]|uniref:hypothetical protein n=1 Tax=Spirillospora sp. CA-294931 TaxID=3240042 RepID=UPI003D8D2F00